MMVTIIFMIHFVLFSKATVSISSTGILEVMIMQVFNCPVSGVKPYNRV